jgi:hypothetical protein
MKFFLPFFLIAASLIGQVVSLPSNIEIKDIPAAVNNNINAIKTIPCTGTPGNTVLAAGQFCYAGGLSYQCQKSSCTVSGDVTLVGSGGASLGYYFMSQAANAPANGVNLGALSTGLLKITVSGAVATPSTASAGTDYVIPSGSITGNAATANALVTTVDCISGQATTGINTSGVAQGCTAYALPNANTTGTAANLSGTPALPNGTTATTQTTGDNTAKVATDAFVLANAGTSGVNLQGSAPGTQQTGNINVSGVIEADGGFSSGPTGSLLLQGLAEAAPTVTLPSIYIDSTGGIPYFLNASSVLTAEMIKGIANPSDSEVVAYVDQAGVQHRVTQSGGGSTRTWPATFAGLVQAGVAGFSANLPATNAPTPTNSGATDPVAVLDFPQGSSADYAWWWPFSSLPTGYVSNSNIAYTLTSQCKVGACDSTHATSVVLSWACSTTGPTDTPTWNATSAVNITNASSGGVKTSGTITPTCAAGSALGIKILPTTTSLTSGDSFQLVSAYFSVQGGM